jgi:hypothetical protein
LEHTYEDVREVVFSDGSKVKVSKEHPWLIPVQQTKQYAHNMKWVTTDNLQVGWKVPRYFLPWETNLSHEAGYLKGFMDGEGALSQGTVSFHQNAGPTCEYANSVFTQLGYKTSQYKATNNVASKNHKLVKTNLHGRNQAARFLGQVRPMRLLSKWTPEMLGSLELREPEGQWVQIVAVNDLGRQKIVRFATSTHTYMLEGFGAHNCLFDLPRLKQEGYITKSVAYDYQDGWHMLQSDLPRGLEFVSSVYTRQMPWKHLNNSNPGLYSCIDADVALQNAIGIKEDLENNNQWETFVEDSVELMPILVRAGERGNAIDVDYSRALKAEMLEEKRKIIESASTMVPLEIRPRTHYKRDKPQSDHPVVEIIVPQEKNTCSHCGQIVGNWTEHLKGGKKSNPCKAADATKVSKIVDVVEWDIIEPFNIGSSDQIKDYIRYHGHPMGQDRKTKKDSANAKHIEKLASKYGDKHPLYHLKLKEAKLSKVLGTYVYCDRMDSNGLIHSTYLNSPSTWRLAARNENLTNVGKRQSNPWAVKARRQIVARDGHIFVQADSTSIEAIITGWLIQDDNFIAIAKKSIHAYLVCAELGLPFTDSNIELAKTAHKKLYSQFKTAVYLLLYGGDPYLMFMENPELFPTKEAAQLIQDKIFHLLPALKKWQEDTRARAKKESYLVGPWGHRHYFYDVHTFKKDKNGNFMYNEDGSPKLKMGQDSKKALAFMPQHIAAKFGRDSLRIIGNSEWGQMMPANCFTHDSYCLEVPESRKLEAAEFLIKILTRPIPQLDGLRIGCEVEFGYNWADQDSKKIVFEDGNPQGQKTWQKVEV